MKTMLLTKLRAFVAVAVVAFVGAGVVGLAYRTGAAEPGAAPQSAAGASAAADDLEALRLEVEALRKSLQATRERVRTLEAEVQALKREAPRPQGPGGPEHGKPAPQAAPAWHVPYAPGFPFERGAPDKPAGTADPLVEAEAALKKLKEHPDDKQAADALEKALKQLKERAKAQKE
jgi:hypothetical protein